jgi:hypothetical protein
MSFNKIALIFFLGVVAALSIRSLQADPIPADAIQPALEITIIARQPVLETLKNAVKYNGGAVLEFLGKQASKSVDYLEGKSNFKLLGIPANPITLTKNSCSFINNHREAVATAAVIFGSIYVYNKHKKWREDNIKFISELREKIKVIKGEADTGKPIDFLKDPRIIKTISLDKNYRTWIGLKHKPLISTVKKFFRDNPKLSDVSYHEIVSICDKTTA